MKITGYFEEIPSGFELDFCFGGCGYYEMDTETIDKLPYLSAEGYEFYLEGTLFFWAWRVALRTSPKSLAN